MTAKSWNYFENMFRKTNLEETRIGILIPQVGFQRQLLVSLP